LHQSDQAIIFFQKREMRRHEITFNTNPSEAPRARADFTYKITPTMISITGTGLGSCPVIEEIEAVLRKIEYWHRGSIVKFKIMCRTAKDFGIEFDGTAKQRPCSPWRKPTSDKPARSCLPKRTNRARGTTNPKKETLLPPRWEHC